MSTTSSCQPHHHRKCNSSGTRKFRLEKILGREPSVFSGSTRGRRSGVFVSAGADLDLQKLSTKSAQARFAFEKLSRSELFWKMGLATCARDCSERSVSDKNRQKTVALGALSEDEVAKMCTRL